VEIVVDAGASAKTLNRPGLERSLAMLRSGEADALLVVKLDRLTRSVRDLGELVERYFAGDRWALLSVGEQIDTRTAAGRLVLNILASVAQWEREAVGERTSAAMAHKKDQGEYTGGRVPYGWALSSDGVNLEPCPNEQQAIGAALDLREAGLSLRKVGAELTARGLLPRSGGMWHAKTVRDLLRQGGGMSDQGPPVDLARVQKALAALDTLLTEHPEIRERTAAFLAGDPPTDDLETLMADNKGQPVKLPGELLNRIDSMVPRLERFPEIMAYGRVSRTAVIRLALTRGLQVLDRELAQLEDKEG
jgi:DNA invertase Pin-like site-specific DNA recombinase